MICEYFGGPKDGDTVTLPHETEIGYVHGVLPPAENKELHPFVQPLPQDLISTCPAVVALYVLNGISHHMGHLDFKGYARHKGA